jgi:hydroxyacylglutathione hydrolase
VAALDPEAVERLLGEGAVLLDVRNAAAFGAGHVPGALNIGLQGQFASWAGTLLPAEKPLVIVAEDEAGAQEAALRLSRVGVEAVAGYLEGGVAAWAASGREVATLPQITVDELRARIDEGSAVAVLDVRRPGEHASGHVPGAHLVPLDRLSRETSGLEPSRPLAVICAGGYRSSAACSLLEQRGFKDLVNVVGGTAAWIQGGHPVESGTPAA